MANTKKTTTKYAPKEKVVENTEIKNENVNDDVTVVTEEKKVVKEPKKFEPMDGIICRSICEGILVMEGVKSHNVYTWENVSDETEVEYQDLVSAVRSKTGYITSPMFIIEDDDFLAQFPQVQKIYDTMYTTSDLKDILRLPINEMIEEINKLPDGSKENIQTIAGKMILNGSLDSLQKIKALDALFDTNYLITTNMY